MPCYKLTIIIIFKIAAPRINKVAALAIAGIWAQKSGKYSVEQSPQNLILATKRQQLVLVTFLKGGLIILFVNKKIWKNQIIFLA